MRNLTAATRLGCWPRATKHTRQPGSFGGLGELEALSFSMRQGRAIPASRLANSLEFRPARFHYLVIGPRGMAGRLADVTFHSVRTASNSLDAVSLRMLKDVIDGPVTRLRHFRFRPATGRSMQMAFKTAVAITTDFTSPQVC